MKGGYAVVCCRTVGFHRWRLALVIRPTTAPPWRRTGPFDPYRPVELGDRGQSQFGEPIGPRLRPDSADFAADWRQLVRFTDQSNSRHNLPLGVRPSG